MSDLSRGGDRGRRFPEVRCVHDPGTPDGDVDPMRLEGRKAFRRAGGSVGPSGPPSGYGRVEWWLGWYDERLRGLFGR